MEIEFVRCIKEKTYFTIGKVYRKKDGNVFDREGYSWCDWTSENCFKKVIQLHVPVLKYPIIYFILNKLSIKYKNQYKAKIQFKDIGFENCSNIPNKILNIYNNINLLYKNNLFQVHCCKVKMMIDSIDTYFKMYANKTLDDKGFQNIYNILCKYNNFLTTENSYVRNKQRKNEDNLKNKSGEILNNILDEQNKILDTWIEDLKEFNK